jgi:hypothetical protein
MESKDYLIMGEHLRRGGITRRSTQALYLAKVGVRSEDPKAEHS